MTATIIATITGNIVILITAILGYLSQRQKVRGVSTKVDSVHSLVNNQLDRQLKYNQQLAATLTKSGIDIPEQEAQK